MRNYTNCLRKQSLWTMKINSHPSFKSLKILSLSLILNIFVAFNSAQTSAQDYQYDIDVNDALRNQRLSQMADKMRREVMLDDQIIMRGAVKIKAGKASTRFVPSASAYEYSARILKWNQNETQDINARASFLQTQVKKFEDRMLKAGGYTINDNVEATNFAYQLSFEAYYDKKLAGQELKQSQLTRQKDRQMLLNHSLYQGSDNLDKQHMYIHDAIIGLQAIEWRERARQTISLDEKQWASEKAKLYANYKLKLNENTNSNLINILSTTTVSNTPFVKASVTFERNRNVLLSQNKIVVNHPFAEIGEWKNLMREFDAEVERRGGAINDAAWSNAVAFAYAYEIYTDGQVKLSDTQLKWIVDEMTKDMLSSQEYQSLSNDEKQKYYEMIALEIMYLYKAYNYGINKGFGQYYSKANAIRDAKAQLINIFTPRNFDEYILTPTGFIKKQ